MNRIENPPEGILHNPVNPVSKETMNDPAREYQQFKAFALSQHAPIQPMSELTQNTINFCRKFGPFRSLPQASGGKVHDRRGLAVATCERIDDAWTIAEALNEAAAGREAHAPSPQPSPVPTGEGVKP